MLANWWRDFGDNDVLGWETNAAYFIVAALCFNAARRPRRIAPDEVPVGIAPSEPRRATARDWAVIGAGVLLLGLNKQLDLQILARRWVGRLMFLCLSAAILWVVARSARHLRRARKGHNLTLAGLAMLACFLIVRAAGYQPYLRDLNLRYKDVIHVVFEVGGLLLVGLSALRGSPRGASARRPPPQLEHQ